MVFSDMGSKQVLRVDLDGTVEEVCVVEGRPSGIGWLPDGRMLVVSMNDRRVVRLEPDGTLAEHAGAVSPDGTVTTCPSWCTTKPAPDT